MLKITSVVFLLLCMMCSSIVYAEDKDVALVLKTAGTVGINKYQRTTLARARLGQRLDSGDKVRTGRRSLAALVFTDDKSLMKVRSNSSVIISGKREDNSIVKRIKLAFGELWAKVTKQDVSMRIEAPSGVATVKGTEFNCLFANGTFFVFCQEGLIELANQLGTLLLGPNQMAKITQGQPPERIQGDPNDIFDMSDDLESRELEIEFEDADGNKKSLILDFE